MSKAFWLTRLFAAAASRRSSAARPSARRKLLVETLEDRRVPATFVPDVFTDEFDGNFGTGDLSLREAVHLANITPGADTITLQPTVYLLSLAGRGENNNVTGDLDVTDPAGLTIRGAFSAPSIIDAGGIDRAFEVIGSGALTLVGVWVRGGSEVSGGGFSVSSLGSLTLENSSVHGNVATNRGGGVDNSGTLTVIASTFASNIAGDLQSIGAGGAINNSGGVVSIQNSEFTSNDAGLEGGAINDRSGEIEIVESIFMHNRAHAAAGGGGAISTIGTINLTVADSTFTGNVAVKGGAIQGRGTVTITGSLLHENQATIQAGTTNLGGAIYNTGTMKVVNSTIADNVAGSGQTVLGFGGAIDNIGSFQLIHATVTGNRASDGGGIRTGATAGVFTVANSIIAQNTTTAAGNRLDVWNAFNSLGGNFIGYAGGSTGWIASDQAHNNGLADPKLGQLQFNGGPTFTRAPLDGSPVLDAGVDFIPLPAGTLPDTDQRGLPRPSGAGYDIGAVERQVAPPVNRAPVALADSYAVNEDAVLAVPVVGAAALDQQSEPIGWWFNAGLGQYDWQQQVRAGAGGLLTAVEFFLGANSAVGAAFEFYVNRGPAWQTAPDDFTAPITVTAGMLGQWVTVDVAAAGIFLAAGDYFTWGARNGNGQTALLLGSAENETGDAYPDGKLWRNGAPLGSSTNFDLRFRTLVAAEAGVLANDSDPDGDPITAVLVAGPAHGTLSLNADGSFSYTPAANYHGPDSFTYRAFDGELHSSIATVSLTVNPVNDAPTAADNSYTTDEDTPLVVATASGVLTGDADVDGDALTAVLVAGPAHGTLSLNGDGSFSYTPAANYHGPDSFTYRAFDGELHSGIATVNLTVNPVNDAPTAADNSYTTDEDTPLVVAAASGVLTGDADVDGDPITAVFVAGPAHGTLTLNDDGSFSYTPAADYHGPDSFTYRAFDGELHSGIATVSLTVDPVNDAPIANSDGYSVDQNGSLAVSAAQGVLANDTDVDGDQLTAVLATGPANGTLTLNADGSFNYVPAFRFYGTDSFTYQSSDGGFVTAPVTVTIVVNRVTHTVPIDIDPGDSTNTIDVNRDSKVEVAILSTATFDAQNVIVESLRFGKTGTEDSLVRHPKTGRLQYRYEDVNGDGRLDLIVAFDVEKTGLAVGDDEAVLRGELADGSLLEAADLVNVVAANKPGKGRK